MKKILLLLLSIFMLGTTGCSLIFNGRETSFTLPNGGGELTLQEVPAGTFTMGSPSSESERYENETQHEVRITRPYLMGTYEVAQQQWEAVMGYNPSCFTGDRLPVERITWYDAVEFCNELSRLVGKEPVYTINGERVSCDFNKNGFRLPTEAEWEYAARGGGLDNYKVYAGSNNLSEVGWYYENFGDETHLVGQKEPNALGIYDMSGNVWEWCWDWYDDYAVSSETNPIGPASGSDRVARGGSWDISSEYCRSANRYSVSPGGGCSSLGFRLAVSLP